MPQVTMYGGGKIDVPSAREIAEVVSAQEREKVRGIKDMRLPQITGTASGSAITLGKGIAQVGPESGHKWSVLRIVVTGMTTGSSPDILNMYVNDTGGQPIWQFNGNNFGYTFNPREMVLNPGETLMFASSGTFAATGVITVSGQVDDVIAEMFGKYGL
jgi:hypothetical protein